MHHLIISYLPTFSDLGPYYLEVMYYTNCFKVHPLGRVQLLQNFQNQFSSAFAATC